MPARPTPTQQQEFEDLHRVLSVICGHFDEVAPMAGGFSWAGMLEVSTVNLSGLRSLRTDLLEALQGYTPAQKRELDARLRRNLGVSLDSVQARELARIAAVRARGKITSDDQYYVLRGRMEVIWDDPERIDEFDALQSLTTSYEERAAKRGTRRRNSAPGAG
jgi:hypothetical protein